jgi:CelD/BcsL family acetyltransferase involved in cellulose biosynthesis
MPSSGAADSQARARPSPGARIVAPPLAPTGGQADLARAPSLAAEWKTLAELDAADIDAWRDLVARALEPNVFLEPSFALAAAKFLPRERDAGAILVRDGERLLGLVPGRVEGFAAGRPVSTFVGWTHAYAPLSTPLLDRDAAKEVIGCVRRALRKLPGKPRLMLDPLVSEDGAVARLRAAELAEEGISISRFEAHERAMLRPAADLGFTRDRESMRKSAIADLRCRHPLASISGGRLKELRRQRRRLGELGVLARRVIARPEIAAAIEAYLALEARGWKGKAGGAAQLDVATRLFLKEAVGSLAAEGKARIDLLTLDEKPLAAAVTLFSGGRAWFWKTAYDEDYARFSPGVQLALDLTEELGADAKISLVDSCAVAGHPMIDHLWSERLAIADWMMPLDAAGGTALAAAMAAEKVRRLAIHALRAVRRIARD